MMSTFSLVVICLGAGTITVPYLFYENGIFVGTLLLAFGAYISLYTGYLIAYAAEMTGGKSYEEIAQNLYGESGMRFTSFCNILCNIGFLVSYTTLVSTIGLTF